MLSLELEVQKFGRRLRRDFHVQIATDPRGFKREVIGLLRQCLPPRRGRPCSFAVTRALEMRENEVPWPKVYQKCLPAFSDSRERFNLRVAVRMRKVRLKRLSVRPTIRRTDLGDNRSMP